MGRFTLPDRWAVYRPMGDVIPGTRFIAFKVPLMLRYFHGKGLERVSFTTNDLCEHLGQRIRLVIDLSCKKVGMYYNPQDLENNGIQYVKLAVEGKKVPSEDVMARFRQIVKNFESQNPPDSFIGVHCTHGVNRTGYVICRYMIEHLNKSTDEALKAFEIGRGYPLERENYIEALRNFEKTKSGGQDDLKPIEANGCDSFNWSEYEGQNLNLKIRGGQRRRHFDHNWDSSGESSGHPFYGGMYDNGGKYDNGGIYDDYRSYYHQQPEYYPHEHQRVEQHYIPRPSRKRSRYQIDNYHLNRRHQRSVYKWRKEDHSQRGNSQVNTAGGNPHNRRSHLHFE